MNFVRENDVLAEFLVSLTVTGPQSIIHTGPAWEQIKILPVEVLSEIFLLLSESWSYGSFRLRSQLPQPLQLARIFSAWRQVAFATPRLWAYIRITLPTKRLDVYEELLREWIARSGACPLRLEIFGDVLSTEDWMKNFQPIFALLLQNRSRWRTVNTPPFRGLLAVMLDGEHDFPLLQSLCITNRNVSGRMAQLPPPSPWPFNNCPQLEKLRTSLKHSHLLVDWNLIRELDITVDIVECLSYLNSSARTVRKCSIELENCMNRDLRGLDNSMISLICATTVSLSVGECSSEITALMARICLPALKRLTIFIGDDMMEPWIPEFIQLTLRSSWKLLDLHISNCTIDTASETQILEMLSHLPLLENLSLTPRCDLSPKFFNSMNPSKTPALEVLLPALKGLMLRPEPGSFTMYPALIDMLESRIPTSGDNNSPALFQQLYSVEIEAWIGDNEDEQGNLAQAQLVKAKIPGLESRGTKLVVDWLYF